MIDRDHHILVDLDGTLADDRGLTVPFDPNSIGEPIPRMVERIKQHLAEGYEVRIFTARMDLIAFSEDEITRPIQQWCIKHLGQVLPITNRKEARCGVIYDDRARQVLRNEGIVVGEPSLNEEIAYRNGRLVRGMVVIK